MKPIQQMIDEALISEIAPLHDEIGEQCARVALRWDDGTDRAYRDVVNAIRALGRKG